MKLHIVQVITELEPAGAERILADLSIELLNRNCSVSVIALQRDPKVKTILNVLEQHNIEVFFLNVTKATPWRIFKLGVLIENIRRANPSSELLVHSHLMHANLACRAAKLSGYRFPLLNTIHIAEKRKTQSILFILDKLSIRFCDTYTAVSSVAARWHAEKLKIPAERIKVVHNGICPPKKLERHGKDLFIEKLQINNCSKIIGSVGRLDYQKGYDIFLKSLPELSKKIPKNETWAVIILGEGPQRTELEILAKDILPNIKVVMPGYREDAAQYIEAFDLFVMPSRYEGLSLTLIEAVSSGVPIVLSDDADKDNEIVKYCKNACKVDFTNTVECIEKILEYVYRSKTDNYISEFSIEKMTDNYLELYRSIT